MTSHLHLQPGHLYFFFFRIFTERASAQVLDGQQRFGAFGSHLAALHGVQFDFWHWPQHCPPPPPSHPPQEPLQPPVPSQPELLLSLMLPPILSQPPRQVRLPQLQPRFCCHGRTTFGMQIVLKSTSKQVFSTSVFSTFTWQYSSGKLCSQSGQRTCWFPPLQLQAAPRPRKSPPGRIPQFPLLQPLQPESHP